MTAPRPHRIDVWHNILWSKYKGEVFSSLHQLAEADGNVTCRFFQIAETEGSRVGLTNIDTRHHRYPYTLLFKGSYEQIGFRRRLAGVLRATLRSDADLTILTGYHKIVYWAQLLALRMKGQKVAVFCDSTFYDHEQNFFQGLLKRLFFMNVDGVFSYGARSRDYAIYYGARPDRAFFRRQAAAMPFDYTPDQARALRRAQAPQPDAPRFLFVGRLAPEKNLALLLEAFAKVHRACPAARLTLVGNGPLRPLLESLAQKLGLTESIDFAGSKNNDELALAYAQATALLLPSLSETWGLVVNEALAYGCPAIVSERCGCVPELIIPGKTGFTHKPGDADELAEKMLIAPAHFADIEATTQTCLELMAAYTPATAAAQMLAGCREILAR